MSKNKCGKTRELDNPYEVWKCKLDMSGDIINIEYRVLKKYQAPENEANNPNARWFVAAKSEATFGSWEYGDNYVRDITTTGIRVDV